MIFWKHSIRNYMLIPFMIFIKAPVALIGLFLLQLGEIGNWIMKVLLLNYLTLIKMKTNVICGINYSTKN